MHASVVDTLQKIMMDRSIQYCSYYISYRDSDTDTMNQIEKMKDNVQSLGLQLYNIRVGPMGKEAANSLVSETFVRSHCSSNIQSRMHILILNYFILSSAFRQA